MKEQLIGAWELVSCERRMQDGESDLPMGENPQGLLIYLPDGHMSVQFMRRERATFASGDIWKGTPKEYLDAFVSYTAYFGRYELNGDVVVHHIEGSTFPNWSGNALKRTISWRGDTLVLTTPPFMAGEKTGIVEMVWKRNP